MLGSSEDTGAAQIFLQEVAVPCMGAFTLVKSLCKKYKSNHV